MDLENIQSRLRSMFETVIGKKRFCTATAVGLVFVFYFIAQLFIPLSLKQEMIEVEIPSGASFRQAYDILKDNGLVRDKYVMIFLGRLTGLDRKIKAGYYSFWDKQMPVSVLCALLDGKIVEYEMTVVEGDTVWDVAAKLSESEIMSEGDFFQLYNNEEFLGSLNIEAPSVEGYLFPDTYKFPKGIPPAEVLKLMVNTLRAHFTSDMYTQMIRLGFNERQVLTLASIIEKEAVVDPEREIISAVYHNRLKKKMRLQADPTAIYGVKDYRLGVTRKDLRRRTPYNTYLKKGLPPGPIAAAGLKSIMAALYPSDVPYLFFVSKDNREHYFSETIREHTNAVNRFRRERALAKQKSGEGQN